MNLTVGPLPPAVYWRRRALVLGAVLALVILLVSMCGGANGAQTPNHPTAATSTSKSPSAAPTPSVQAPIVGAPGAASGTPSTTPPSATAPASAASDICSDAEIQLTPSVQKINGGSYPYQLNLRIKNISARTCKRDVGSGPQEMHIVNASGQTVWSSDNCQSATGSDVRTFSPNIESAFQLGWDGNANAPGCRPTGALNGTYQLVAKLDTKVSAPVAFTIGPAGLSQTGK
jgi:hypothetical protein